MKKEITIFRNEACRVYKSGDAYYIEYADRDPAAPTPFYRTKRGVQEALYYAGVTESKDAKPWL